MQRKRVLIVDDAPEFAHLVKESLATLTLPLETSVFLSGEEAWLEALKTRFDLVITDLRLPGISGTELVRRLRSRYPDIKIIAVSGLAEAGLSERTRAAGVDAFYRKPVEFPLLLTKIDNLLEESELEEEEPSSRAASRVDTAPLSLPDESLQLTPMHIELMRQLEEILREFMLLSGAEGVAISTGTGNVLVGLGSAQDFKPDSNLVEICAMQKNARKRAGTQSGDSLSNLLVMPQPDSDLIIANLDKFLFWLIFQTGSDSLENGKAYGAWNTACRQLLPVITRLEALPTPRQPHPPRISFTREIEEKTVEDEKPPLAAKEIQEEVPSLPETSIPRDEVNAFWETQSKRMDQSVLSEEAISFDQASNLGLVPDEDK